LLDRFLIFAVVEWEAVARSDLAKWLYCCGHIRLIFKVRQISPPNERLHKISHPKKIACLKSRKCYISKKTGGYQMNATIQSSTRSPVLAMPMIAVLAMWLLSGCSTDNQLHSTTQVRVINLESQSLQASGIAFITPTSVTGQEEDKQALALVFSEALKRARPDLRVVPLSETLGAINMAGLSGEYRKMLEDSRLSGIFSRDTLQKVSQITGVRYLAQLKLGGFQQIKQDRWGFLGIRMVETESTSLRLYLQILDAENGTIAWEGAQELTASIDTLKNAPISFKIAIEQSAKELIARLP
jgi:hypothetical protein